MSYLNYSDKELLKNSRFLRNHMTKAEILLWSRLRSKQIEGLKFRRQQPILHYVVDFYCSSLKLIIEVDGLIHSGLKEAEYDKSREKILLDHGFHILRFTNDEVEFEIDSVLRKIRNYVFNLMQESSIEAARINER